MNPRARHTSTDRAGLQCALDAALENIASKGRTAAAALASSRSRFIENPEEEVNHVFQHYKLGSPRSKIASWIKDAVTQDCSLFGITTFEFVQAITAAARNLDPIERRIFEDAIGEYLNL